MCYGASKPLCRPTKRKGSSRLKTALIDDSGTSDDSDDTDVDHPGSTHEGSEDKMSLDGQLDDEFEEKSTDEGGVGDSSLPHDMDCTIQNEVTRKDKAKEAEPVVPPLCSWIEEGSEKCAYGSFCICPEAHLKSCCMCEAPLHHICQNELSFLRGWIGEVEGGTHFCFECALMAGVLQRKVDKGIKASPWHTTSRKKTGRTRVFQDPFMIGASMASKSLQLFNIGVNNDVCQECEEGGDLLDCSFCNLAFHNRTECLDGCFVLDDCIVNSDIFEWCCPDCLKEGLRSHTSRMLRPLTETSGRKRRSTRNENSNLRSARTRMSSSEREPELLTKQHIMKLKVSDLKTELQRRGLSLDGLKPALQTRLLEAPGAHV